MKILVTGATGFIGTHLLENLVSNNIAIKAIFHEAEPQLNREIIKKIEWIKADITDIYSLQNSLHDVDQIYHCIGLSSQKHTFKEAQKNLLNGSKNIINLAIARNIQKILYISHSSTLQTINEQGLITEQLPNASLLKYHDGYENLCYEVEKEMWRGMAEGLPSIIINPTHILGVAYDWHSLNNNLFQYVYQNTFLNSFPVGHYGFVTLQNVVEAMIALMKSNIYNERFIVSAENRSYEYILSLIAKEFKKPIAKNPFTKNKINQIITTNYIHHLFNKKKNILDSKKLMSMNKTYQYDNSKFLNHFKHFEYQSIATSITEMCKIYKQKFSLS